MNIIFGVLFVVWYVACCLGAYGIWFADFTLNPGRKMRIKEEGIIVEEVVMALRIISCCGPLSLVVAVWSTRIKHGWDIRW